MKNNEETIKPKYAFAEVPEGTEVPDAPIKRQISKTMEVTENFNIFDVMTYIAKMDKSIADKAAEMEGLINMKKAYEAELKLIEDELGVQKMEEEYQKSVAEKMEAESIESPYNEEDIPGDTGITA